LPNLHKALASSHLPSAVNLSPPRLHYLNLWISMCLKTPFTSGSPHCTCTPPPLKIRTLDLSSPSTLRLRAYLSELQPLASATAVFSSSAPTLCRSRIALLSLSSKPILFPPLFSTLVQRVTPSSSSISLPSLAPILPAFVVHPCIFSCLISTQVFVTVAALEDAYTD
jgi:hypothetical protein